MEHPGRPAHYSVKVEVGDESLHTHQDAPPGGASTLITTPAKVPTGAVTGSGTVSLPNAAAAQAAQRSTMAAGDTGPYDAVNNSCVSHVCDVLKAGGDKPPTPRGRDQFKYLKEIVKKPPE